MSDDNREWLVVDVGNSCTAAAVWCPTAGRLTRLRDLPTPAGPEEAAPLASDLARLGEEAGADRLALVSVVPALDPVLVAPWTDWLQVDHRLPLPFAVRISNLPSVGADRLCNVAAARREGMADALIVDLGTATTFDLLLDGVFIGGLIAPGMAFAARQLGEYAARLQPVPFVAGPLEPGGCTAEALARGCYHVGIHGVLGTIAGLLGRYGDLPVILTGGLAGYAARAPWRVEPDWTLLGAAHLATSA